MGWRGQPYSTVLVPRTSYNTTFPATENPISQGGGIWTQGLADGLDWQDVQSTGGSPGICWGTGSSGTGLFNDCIATQQGVYTTNKHYSQITVSLTGGYTPPSTHETEALVGFTISAHSAKGYEMDFGFGTGLQPVRWNGAAGDFITSVFTTLSGATFGVGDGDVVKAVYDSTSGSPVITLFLNSVQQWVITDTTAGKIVTGSPGLGFFARPGTGLDMSKYCVKGFACGNA